MSVVVIGQLSAERSEALRLAVLRVGEEPAFYWDVEDFEAAFTEVRPTPKCLLVDAASVQVDGLTTWVRQRSTLFPVPVVVLLPSVDAESFRELHGFGADDAVAIDDLSGLARRLQKLAEFDPDERPAPIRGAAIVVHAAVGRRAVLGRILRIAGFDVRFAGSAEDLTNVATPGVAPTLAVVHADLPGGAPKAIQTLREVVGAEVPAVVLSPARGISDLRQAAPGLGRVRVERELAPPDHVLFLTNELLLAGVENQRDSARVLHATLCGFRPEGSMNSVFGLTYNLSEGGLYTRTLDAPARGTRLWIELTPPREERAVHLRGEVVWGQRLSNRRGSPPGFGVRFLPAECPATDLGTYVRGYRSLLAGHS